MDLASSIGYKYDPKKGKGYPVFVNKYNGDRIIIINPKSTSNQGYYNPNDSTDKGTLVEFIKNRLGRDFPYDRSFNEYRNVNMVLYAFNKESLPESLIYTPDNRPKKPFTTEGLMDSLVQPGYLLSRNISRKTLFTDEFSGRILNINNDGFVNIAFPYYDKNEKVVGIEKRNYSFNYFVEGSERGSSVWHSNFPKKLDKIIIAESVIDALSYHQLKQTSNALYIAIGGSLSLGQTEVMKALKLKSNVDEGFLFISATDNDKAGMKYDQKLHDELAPEKILIDKPIEKDYNNDLNALVKFGIIKNGFPFIKR